MSILGRPRLAIIALGATMALSTPLLAQGPAYAPTLPYPPPAYQPPNYQPPPAPAMATATPQMPPAAPFQRLPSIEQIDYSAPAFPAPAGQPAPTPTLPDVNVTPGPAGAEVLPPEA